MAEPVQKIVQEARGTFSVDEIAQAVVKSSSISPPSSTSEEWKHLKKLVSNTLGRMVKKGLLERVNGKNGTFRRVGDAPLPGPFRPSLEDEAGSRRLRILRTIPEPLPIRLPLGLEQYVRIYPGDLIVVAGATNAGKTAYFLNLVQLNWHLFPVKYLTSELSDVRLSRRLHAFCEQNDTSLDDWDLHVDFSVHDSNFAPAMDPAKLNVIDYLEIYREFQEVGMPIKDIFKRQQGQPGVTFLGLQMKHGGLLGRGGSLTMEKPFLYLTLDYFNECRLNRLVIEKAKDPARHDVNPNGMDFWFRIEEGCKFIPVEKPNDAPKLVAAARREAGIGK